MPQQIPSKFNRWMLVQSSNLTPHGRYCAVFSSQPDFKKTNTPWYPMNAHAKLISTIRTPHGGYSPANFIKIDPFMDATTQLFPLKFMPYWWSFPTMSLQIQATQPFMDANSSLRFSNLIPHGCYYATNSHRIDAPVVFICKLFQQHWFMGVWFFELQQYFGGVAFLTPWLDLVDFVDL